MLLFFEPSTLSAKRALPDPMSAMRQSPARLSHSKFARVFRWPYIARYPKQGVLGLVEKRQNPHEIRLVAQPTREQSGLEAVLIH
jgi:hypothetical protein